MVNHTYTEGNSMQKNRYPVKIEPFQIIVRRRGRKSVSHGVSATIFLFAPLPVQIWLTKRRKAACVWYKYQYLSVFLLMVSCQLLYHAMDDNSKHKQVFRF